MTLSNVPKRRAGKSQLLGMLRTWRVSSVRFPWGLREDRFILLSNNYFPRASCVVVLQTVNTTVLSFPSHVGPEEIAFEPLTSTHTALALAVHAPINLISQITRAPAVISMSMTEDCTESCSETGNYYQPTNSKQTMHGHSTSASRPAHAGAPHYITVLTDSKFLNCSHQ